MNAICQRCGQSKSSWTVCQAEVNVGKLAYWKLRLCEGCMEILEHAIRGALMVSPDDGQRTT